jgi:hypothetical protein
LILINTLSRLRSQYESIGDEQEARHQVIVGSDKENTVLSVEALHKIAPIIEVPKEKKDPIEIVLESGAKITSNVEVSDAFVFCASIKRDSQLFKQFGYDAYYKILDPQRFAEIAYEKLNEKFEIQGFKIRIVKYSDKIVTIDNKTKAKALKENLHDFWDICFTKRSKFSYQKEFRMVFIPQFRSSIAPQIIQSSELLKCCSF